MKVRMLVGISGMREGKEWPVIGGEIDLPDDEALSLIANEYAEEAIEAPAEAAPEQVTPPADTPAQ